MTTNKVPTFETKRLILKEVGVEHAESYKKYFVDYEVIRNLSSAVPWPYPEDGVVEFLKNVIVPNQGVNRWMWGIFLKSHPDELIGSVDLWREGKPENRGFWLGRKFWGQGIMTEAVEPITDYAFKSLRFEELVFSNAVGNIGSRRIKEKTGATLVAVIPGSFVDPQYTEKEIWKMSRQQWEESMMKRRESS